MCFKKCKKNFLNFDEVVLCWVEKGMGGGRPGGGGAQKQSEIIEICRFEMTIGVLERRDRKICRFGHQIVDDFACFLKRF